MKVVDRTTFLTLPAGTIFSMGARWHFDCIAIKGDTIPPDDFAYCDPAWMGARDSGEAFHHLEQSLETSVSYPCNRAYGRDGCYEQDALFLIFERDDLEWFRDQITKAIYDSAVFDMRAKHGGTS